MIYDTTTETQLTLLRTLLERYGRADATGQKAKKAKARDQINAIVRRLRAAGVIEGYVREIE